MKSSSSTTMWKKVFVATPYTRPFEAEYVASLLSSESPGNLFWEPLPNNPIDVARNVLGQKFLSTNYDYILYADSDATWHPKAITRMVNREVPVITACLYKRGLPPVPTMGPLSGVTEDGYTAYHFGKAIDKIFAHVKKFGIEEDTLNALCLDTTDDDLWEIDGCGMHFCMVHRSVLEAIDLPWFKCSKPGAGEDFYFCRKVQEAGFKIYADLSLHTGHIAGPGFDFGLRELLAFYKFTDALKPREHIWEA